MMFQVMLFGTPVRKMMRKVTVLPAVAQCSLVKRHHYRWAYCLFLLHWWKQRFLWKFGACLLDCRAHKKTVMLKRISPLSRCRKILSMITCSSQGTLIKVCVTLHCSMLFCDQFGKHTITEASVDHCKLPCVASYTNLWAWCFGEWMYASGCWEGCSMERRWLLQNLQVCVASLAKSKKGRDVSLAKCFQWRQYT